MGRRARALAVAVAAVLALGFGVAGAQEPGSTGVPAPNIVPEPDSGESPSEAGDRGGALQLAVLALVVLGVAGAAVHLTRQSRRARADER